MTPGDCIGMLDWGIGGVDCYRLLKRARPDVPVLYWSDTGAVPYGKLSAKDLTVRVQQVIDQLVELGATRLVVACNAASTVLSGVSAEVPITGVIEHAGSVVPNRFRGRLCVIGGARTIRSGLYRRALEAKGRDICSRIAQPLSGHIETGTLDTDAGRSDLMRIMRPLADADAVLLACTHYAAIKDRLQQLAPHAELLDPVPALVDFVTQSFRLTPGELPDRFVTTGDPHAMRAAAQRVWGVTLSNCTKVDLTAPTDTSARRRPSA